LALFSDIRKIRKTVQTGFALFCLYIGYKFYLFFAWATGSSGSQAARPPAVEAFLPISALVSLKQLVMTGIYDSIHPAGLTVFIMALVVSLLFRKGFCGWICPIGFASELAGSAIGRYFIIRLPVWLNYLFLSLKYLLSGFFVYLIVWQMDINSLQSFSRSPYNLTVDGRMLHFFLAPTTLALGIMVGIVLLVLAFRNFWCRFLCPYGALLGLLALASPFQVKRQEKNCIDCKKCEDICPAAIKITDKKTIRTPECIGCLDCAAVCPQKNCLSLTFWQKNIKLPVLPLGLLLLFFAIWAWARLSGHWQTAIPDEVFQRFYKIMKF
jgi:polyferredoxin